MFIADMVWPGLFMANRLLAWYAITFGIVVEYWFIRKITKLDWIRAIFADVTMNLVSALIGLIAIPILGLLWEATGGEVVNTLFHTGTFNPASWAVTICLSAILNVLVEGLIIVFGFRQNIGVKGFLWLYLANIITVGAAFLSFFMFPAEH